MASRISTRLFVATVGIALLPSKPEQPVDLHHQPSRFEADAAWYEGVPPFREDYEQLTARLVLPPETDIGRERGRAGAVLHQCGRVHPWCHGVSRAAADHGVREGSLRDINPVE